MGISTKNVGVDISTIISHKNDAEKKGWREGRGVSFEWLVMVVEGFGGWFLGGGD